MTVRPYSPPNLPSLSQQDRVAWGGLTQWVPLFEDQLKSEFITFDSLADRDAYFTAPEHGDTCLVTFHADPSTGYDHGCTVWVYGNWMSQSFNVFDMWMPLDLQWNQFPVTTTNITVGDGTVTGFYMRQGARCAAKYRFTLGSTSAMGTGPTFSYPFEAEPLISGVYDELAFPVVIGDTGTAVYRGITRYNNSTSFLCLVSNVAATYMVDSGISNIVPHAWASTDVLSVPHIDYNMDLETVVFTS